MENIITEEKKKGMSLRCCGMSDIGLMRDNNEDFFAIDQEAGIYIVADGLGGEQAGEVASRLATESILSDFRTMHRRGIKVFNEKIIDRAIENAHQTILGESFKNTSLQGMGTTVVFAVKEAAGFWVVNVGDSRAYLAREGSIEPVTRDHSLVMGLVAKGKISPEQARFHYLRNIVTQSLGINIDEKANKRLLPVKEGDRLLLCSDGLWDVLSDNAIMEAMFAGKNPESVCISLIEKAKSNGGHDNITVIAVTLEGG